MRRAAGLVLPLLALAACSRSGGKVPASFPKAPVVVVSIDTLRSDHVPAYGYRGVETPALDAFRKDAILFERAYTHVPLTLPAHASLFTGLLPAGHGLRDNAGYRLKAGVPTLAELLKKAGYRTGAAVSAVVLGAGTGLSRGFDFYEDSIEPTEPNQPQSRVQRAGDRTAARLAEWIGRGGDAPIFAFLHLYEPHAPYEPKEPFRSRYANRYDGEIATADAILGEFVAFLKGKGLYDRALVVILSDHGEGLGEHGEAEHGVFVYRSDLQVPLLVKLPGSGGAFPLAGTSAAAPVQISDVFTTVGLALALPGFAPPEGTVSLLDAAAGKTPPDRRVFAESLYPRLRFGWSDLASLIDGSWQLIGAPKVEFYDVAKDPGEKSNVAADKPGPFRSMSIELEKRRGAFEAAAAVSAEEAKKLASLGYLTGSASAPSGPLADPKDEIALLADLDELRGRALAGRPEEALGAIRRILEKNPRMLDVWETYAQILRDRGRLEEALAARRKMVERSPPEATLPLLGGANLCLDLGRTDEAIRNAVTRLSKTVDHL
ncbi:MAG TPA: sulfatase-like hydrolase/transferase, partial [Thermoanaerobaculia bacterium]|nr:sulfatase-like hydrolase/transferase [Thermoanaerobaculia bacterium]